MYNLIGQGVNHGILSITWRPSKRGRLNKCRSCCCNIYRCDCRAFEKGPVGEVTPIGSEEELVKIFGKPNSNNFETFFTAANFLQYSDALRVVRVESGVLNATSNASGLLIRTTDHYLSSFADGQGTVGLCKLPELLEQRETVSLFQFAQVLLLTNKT